MRGKEVISPGMSICLSALETHNFPLGWESFVHFSWDVIHAMWRSIVLLYSSVVSVSHCKNHFYLCKPCQTNEGHANQGCAVKVTQIRRILADQRPVLVKRLGSAAPWCQVSALWGCHLRFLGHACEKSPVATGSNSALSRIAFPPH